jgi:hypothetical protein
LKILLMSYTFKLNLEKTRSKLSLLEDGAARAVRSWPEARDMGTRVFEAMGEILGEAGLRPDEVSDCVVESDLPDVYTSTRIAETLKKVYAFGVKRK